MKILSTVLILLVAFAHLAFAILEMVFWDHPIGREMFDMTEQQSADSAVLAMNQGLYNSFLAAGLLWGVISDRFDVKAFFLGCIIVAGIFGSMTAQASIFFSQALPAILALIATYLAKNN